VRRATSRALLLLATAGTALPTGWAVIAPRLATRAEAACLSAARSGAADAPALCSASAEAGSPASAWALALLDPGAAAPRADARLTPTLTERALTVLRRADTEPGSRAAALADLTTAAAAGFAPAQRWLAVALLADEAGPGREAEAADWLARAARQGSADAMFLLAGLHRTGRGVLQDHQRMRDLYVEAAQRGHAAAAHNLAADFVARGEPEAARAWLLRAAAGGFAPAHDALARKAEADGASVAAAVHHRLAARFSEGTTRTRALSAAEAAESSIDAAARADIVARTETLGAGIAGQWP
jgi:TPR repeat protein